MDFSKIQPTDRLIVYHGTRVAEVFDLINGFDATQVKYRNYGGPRHAGLFVTPSFEVAERFSSYGELVLEIEVRAKNLHGVDYSGNIGRKQEMDDRTRKWLDETYPDSFRPYLSMTLTQSSEPQALLVGLVSPSQIKRVWYNPYGKGVGKWYTRKEFFSLGLSEVPSKNAPYGAKQTVHDTTVDMATTHLTDEQLMEVLVRELGAGEDRLRKLFPDILKRDSKSVVELLTNAGFGPRAAEAHVKRLQRMFRAARLARILREEGLS